MTSWFDKFRFGLRSPEAAASDSPSAAIAQGPTTTSGSPANGCRNSAPAASGESNPPPLPPTLSPLFLHRRPRRLSFSGRIASVGFSFPFLLMLSFSFAQAAADPEFANPNPRDFGPVAISSHQQQPLQACAKPAPTNPNPVGFPLAATFPKTISSSSSMAATAPKWAQKTDALPPHPAAAISSPPS